MKYYKKLDIDASGVIPKIKAFIEENPEVVKGSFCFLPRSRLYQAVPELEHLFDPLGITIKFIAMIYCRQPVDTIHIDDEVRPVRINIPIAGTEGTLTKFWEVSGEPEKRFIKNTEIPYDYYDPAACTVVDQFELDGVYAIRVLEPHSVVCKSPEEPRVSISIGFEEDIEYLLD